MNAAFHVASAAGVSNRGREDFLQARMELRIRIPSIDKVGRGFLARLRLRPTSRTTDCRVNLTRMRTLAGEEK